MIPRPIYSFLKKLKIIKNDNNDNNNKSNIVRHLKMQTLAFQLTFHSGKLYIWVDVWPRLTLHLPTDCRQGHYDWPQICSWWWCDLHKPSLTYQPNKTSTLIRGVSSPKMFPWQGAAQCLIIYFHYCLLLHKHSIKYFPNIDYMTSSFQVPFRRKL